MLNKDSPPAIQAVFLLVDIVDEDDNANNKKTAELVIKNSKLLHEEKLHLHEVQPSHHVRGQYHSTPFLIIFPIQWCMHRPHLQPSESHSHA